jgi:hypothetical protein
MKLSYKTGTIAITQFIAGSGLGFVGGLVSSISGCTSNGNDCVSNTIVSLILIILTAIWFGFLAILGFAALERHSRRLANLLIVAEIFTTLVALFDALHFPNILSLITSLLDAILALATLIAAYHLSRAKGGRVVANSHNRTRQRRHTL